MGVSLRSATARRSNATRFGPARFGPARFGLARFAVVLAATAVAAAACSSPPPAARTATSPAAQRQSPAGPSTAQISVSPAADATGVQPLQPVVVRVAGGVLVSVFLTDTKTPVTGSFDADRTTWTSSGPLGVSTTYGLSVHAVDRARREVSSVTSFTTLTPKAVTYPGAMPLDGATVGIGMPIVIYWSKPVTDHATAERLLSVTASKPVEGAWNWFSDTEVHWRPKTFWPAYTHVTVQMNVGGHDLGGGVYGETNRTLQFDVGSAVITTIENATKTMTVTENGQVLRRIPVSLGRPNLPTSSGTMIVFEKWQEQMFDSSTFGIPVTAADGYKTKVYWDVKYTFGGEYVHAAPWSVAQQGKVNVSHGCVNISPEAAQWYYNLSKYGDIITITGTERQVKPGDGFTDWNMPWDLWKAGSALA